MMALDEAKLHISLSLVFLSMCEISGLRLGKKNDLSLISMSIIRECIQSKVQVGDIARMNRVSYGTATECVINLERKGYVERVKGTEDGRSVYVVPTEKAMAWVGEIEKKMHAYTGAGMSRLGADEQGQLIDLLARFCGLAEGRPLEASLARALKEAESHGKTGNIPEEENQ